MDAKSALFYEAFRTLLGPFLALHFRIKTEGAGNVPDEGGAIVVANHRCYLDPFVLAYTITRYINFAAGSHLYLVPGTRKIFELAGFFSMHIYGGKEGDESLNMASQLLSRGELVGIFPEGIESFMRIAQVSKIADFKTGFAKVALECRVPVIPAAIIGIKEKSFPKVPGLFIKPFVDHPATEDGIRLISYKGIICRVGRPLDLSAYFDEGESKDLLDRIAGRVRRIIIKLYEGEDLERLMVEEGPLDLSRETA